MIPLSFSPSLRGHLGYLPFPWLVGRSAGWRFCSHRGGRLGPELYPYSGLTLPYPYGGYANGRVSGRIGSRPLRSSAKTWTDKQIKETAKNYPNNWIILDP